MPDSDTLEQEAAAKKRELDLKEREVAAKEREADAKVLELNRSRWLNPTVLGLFAAAIGLLGNVVVTRINNSNTQDVERIRSEANVILEAIRTGTGNTDAACKNLRFLVTLGLVRDLNQKIATQCQAAPIGPPSLPASQIENELGGSLVIKILDDETKTPIAGVRILAQFSSSTDSRYTDATGVVLFTFRSSVVSLRAEKDGYHGREATLAFQSFGTHEHTMSMFRIP